MREWWWQEGFALRHGVLGVIVPHGKVDSEHHTSHVVCRLTNSKVVDERENPCRANSVVCPNISHDRELRRQWDARSEKVAEELREGTASWPELEGVENELVAPVCVSIAQGFVSLQASLS